MLLVRCRLEDGRLPELGGEVPVRLGQGEVHGLDEVTQGAGVPAGRRVAVLHAGHAQELLGHGSGDQPGTARGRDQTHANGAALAGNLVGHRVGEAILAAPVAAADGHHRHLGDDDRAADGGGHLLRALDAETDVAALVSDSHERLETGDLTGGRHLLHRHDLHHLVLQLRAKEEVHDLVLCWFGLVLIDNKRVQGEGGGRGRLR